MVDRLGQTASAIWCDPAYVLGTLVAPAALIGANGLRQGPDRRLYVAQAFGSQISAIDLASSDVQIVSRADGAIAAPDDLAFDSDGSLYATEVMSARVSAVRPNGVVEVIATEVPVANGITIDADLIFISEFRPEGRILQLSKEGGVPLVIASGLMMPNALCMGPDGCLYFPLVPLGEIWRVSADGKTQAERVAGGFAIPTAVKFDRDGSLVVAESGTGDITRVNVVNGRTSRIAKAAFGLDNLTFDADGGLYVSHFTDGSVSRINPEGVLRNVVPGGMLGPYGMCAGVGGELIVADGMSLAVVDRAGGLTRPAMLLQHGFPGYLRGIATTSDGSFICTNSAGTIMRYGLGTEATLLAAGLDRAMDVIVRRDEKIIICEAGSGKVLEIGKDGSIRNIADGLREPTGVCAGPAGTIFVSEASGGRVVAIDGEDIRVLMQGLSEPHGLAYDGRNLFVLDRDTQTLHRYDFEQRAQHVVATGLPVGAGPGRGLKALPGIGDLMPGPLSAFAALALLPDGRLCIGCDGDGSIRILERR